MIGVRNCIVTDRRLLFAIRDTTRLLVPPAEMERNEDWGFGTYSLQGRFTTETMVFIQRQEIYLIPLKWQYIAMVFKEYDQVSRISRSCEYHILQRYLLNCVSIPVYYYNPSVGSPGGTWSLPGWCSWCGVIRPAAATPHSATLLSHITLKEGDSVSQAQCNL